MKKILVLLVISDMRLQSAFITCTFKTANVTLEFFNRLLLLILWITSKFYKMNSFHMSIEAVFPCKRSPTFYAFKSFFASMCKCVPIKSCISIEFLGAVATGCCLSFTSKWDLLCLLSNDTETKSLEQTVHANLFSPICVFLCSLKTHIHAMLSLQYLHLNRFPASVR